MCLRRHRRNRCDVCDRERARQRQTLLVKYRERHAMCVLVLGGKCAECDATEGLEFDHIEQTTKRFSITASMTIALPKLLAELSKCRLLCAAHHRKTPSYGRARSKAYEDVREDVTFDVDTLG